jgi:hypothetical protein
MNEIFMLLVCFDEEDNIYDRYFFTTFEKAFEFAKTFAKDFIKRYKWKDIEDEMIEDLRKYGNLADFIYIEKVILDDGKTY